MPRAWTIRWEAPAPAPVAEELAGYDDGTVRLVVGRGRVEGAAVGTWSSRDGLPAGDVARLTAAGPGPLQVDPRRPPVDDRQATVLAAAERAADSARTSAEAVGTFHVRVLGPGDGGRTALSLLVVGSGTRAVELQLDPTGCAVLCADADDRRPLTRVPLPELPTGFMTAELEGLGGVERRAVVPPGSYGAIAFDVVLPPGAATVAVHVDGWLVAALPDDPRPRPFSAVTARVPAGPHMQPAA